MTTNLPTLVAALYVKIDDDRSGIARLPGRPPRPSHSELPRPAVMQAVRGFHSEARRLRHVCAYYRGMFPHVPQDAGHEKRLRATLPQVKRLIRALSPGTPASGTTPWICDSTPVPCGMSRPTVKRSEVVGWAGYGCCSSPSRFYRGLRLFLA